MEKNKGFTFIELITATVILAIAVAGVYAAFLSSARFTNTFRHEVMAAIAAQGYLDKARAESVAFDPSPLLAPFNILGYNGVPIDIPTSDILQQLNTEVNNLQGSYSAFDGNLSANGTDNPEYSFKVLAIRLRWNERQI